MAQFDTVQAQIYVEGHRLTMELGTTWLGVCRCALWTDTHADQDELRIRYFDHLRTALEAAEDPDGR